MRGKTFKEPSLLSVFDFKVFLSSFPLPVVAGACRARFGGIEPVGDIGQAAGDTETLCPLCQSIEGSADIHSPGEVLLFVEGVDWYCAGVQVLTEPRVGTVRKRSNVAIHSCVQQPVAESMG
jgi:hypothetical protein